MFWKKKNESKTISLTTILYDLCRNKTHNKLFWNAITESMERNSYNTDGFSIIGNYQDFGDIDVTYNNNDERITIEVKPLRSLHNRYGYGCCYDEYHSYKFPKWKQLDKLQSITFSISTIEDIDKFISQFEEWLSVLNDLVSKYEVLNDRLTKIKTHINTKLYNEHKQIRTIKIKDDYNDEYIKFMSYNGKTKQLQVSDYIKPDADTTCLLIDNIRINFQQVIQFLQSHLVGFETIEIQDDHDDYNCESHGSTTTIALTSENMNIRYEIQGTNKNTTFYFNVIGSILIISIDNIEQDGCHIDTKYIGNVQ